MATLIVEAVYQHGVLKPREPLDLKTNERLRITIEPIESDTLSLAADDPCGAFPELDISFETIEALTASSWEPKVEKLLDTITQDQ